MFYVFQTIHFLTIVSLALAVKHGGYSYNRFSGPVSGKIVEVQVPAALEIAAQQHASYGYDHNRGEIDPETQKYAHLKTVDYVASIIVFMVSLVEREKIYYLNILFH